VYQQRIMAKQGANNQELMKELADLKVEFEAVRKYHIEHHELLKEEKDKEIAELKEYNKKLKEENKTIKGGYFKESEFDGQFKAMSKNELIGYCEVLSQRAPVLRKDWEKQKIEIEQLKDWKNTLEEENKKLTEYKRIAEKFEKERQGQFARMNKLKDELEVASSIADLTNATNQENNKLREENKKLKEKLELKKEEWWRPAYESFEEAIVGEYGDQSEQAKKYGFGVFKKD